MKWYHVWVNSAMRDAYAEQIRAERRDRDSATDESARGYYQFRARLTLSRARMHCEPNHYGTNHTGGDSRAR